MIFPTVVETITRFPFSSIQTLHAYLGGPLGIYVRLVRNFDV